ncbi:CRISPR-associated exonuclease Cas4 [Gracilibacillus ureilyticus]|uniref:CRISPR-associated exonuclease Cas4 n=1 Tax=Gracilibacillus ureilyticus TaxID=531814 RepID=A0A1H9W0G4_9BACI|nr:CRISPR-associated protein Cas4 [Gracilibacillus ureilyticus]SES27328.1 CRISPR-associated exonuclease Cas4 [Gracilibacillus ureilyticus]
MDSKEDFLMLSGIQHFRFCKRQWALIHIEQQWAENVKTVQGQHLHNKADQPFVREKRKDKLIVRALPVHSNELKITGICDVVQFEEDEKGISLQLEEGKYLPYPVEYKRGKPKKSDIDVLQLVAQAMCLEEMLLCEVKKGYLYYGETKRRVEVNFSDQLKQNVRDIVVEMQQYYKKKYTPKVKTGAFCKQCSLQNICLPKILNKTSVARYIDRMLKE